MITCENDIPWGQAKITQHLGSQKIRLHRASIILPRTYELHVKMIPHGDKSRLLEIGILRKYEYTGPRCLYTEHEDYIWK